MDMFSLRDKDAILIPNSLTAQKHSKLRASTTRRCFPGAHT
jgi:hypothetical protein